MSNELEFSLEVEAARVDAKPEPCINGLGNPPNKMLQGGNDDRNAKKALAEKQSESEDKPIV